MILGLMMVRKMLDWVFSQHDLAWLDDILPEKDKKKQEDKTRRRKGRKIWRVTRSEPATLELCIQTLLPMDQTWTAALLSI
ncbi:unnamed protein product [Staurois parvus]|uniref:Uncharacterized protein n=1 Tax=Staurois parvus TaxID=386267 RepID=A0ABN9GNM3_9NEOB|nr:unnamed protein product [Staurois parvus]